MYRTFKTTMGRKYKVRMTKEEVAEKELYDIVLVIVTFVCSALMMLTWVKAV